MVKQVNRTRVKEVQDRFVRLMFLKHRLYCKIVVALTLIDLRRRGKTGRLGMCGTNGKKLPDIRKHMQESIGNVYKEMDLTMDWWSVKIDRFFVACRKLYFL